MNPPSSSSQILDLALNTETGEISIGGVLFKPSGTGTDHVDVARDDGRAAFDSLVQLRNECFDWRHFAARIDGWVSKFPSQPRTKL